MKNPTGAVLGSFGSPEAFGLAWNTRHPWITIDLGATRETASLKIANHDHYRISAIEGQQLEYFED
jgi:hypothetical protein